MDDYTEVGCLNLQNWDDGFYLFVNFLQLSFIRFRKSETDLKSRLQHHQLLATFNQQWNDTISSVFVGSLFMGIGAVSVLAFYETIRQYGKLDLLQYLMGPIILFDVMIVAIGMTYSAGRIVIESANHINKMKAKCSRDKVLRRKIKSLRPFGMRITILPAIKKEYLLGFLFIVSNLAFTALVSSPNNTLM